MPLVILGIIVVVGACLMIYYQIGLTRKARAGSSRGAASSRANSSNQDTFGGYIHVEVVPELDADSDADAVIPAKAEISEDADAEKLYDKSTDGKVLYIFDGGKTEIRTLDEADDPDFHRDGRDKTKENPSYPDDDDVG